MMFAIHIGMINKFYSKWHETSFGHKPEDEQTINFNQLKETFYHDRTNLCSVRQHRKNNKEKQDEQKRLEQQTEQKTLLH